MKTQRERERERQKKWDRKVQKHRDWYTHIARETEKKTVKLCYRDTHTNRHLKDRKVDRERHTDLEKNKYKGKKKYERQRDGV